MNQANGRITDGRSRFSQGARPFDGNRWIAQRIPRGARNDISKIPEIQGLAHNSEPAAFQANPWRRLPHFGFAEDRPQVAALSETRAAETAGFDGNNRNQPTRFSHPALLGAGFLC